MANSLASLFHQKIVSLKDLIASNCIVVLHLLILIYLTVVKFFQISPPSLQLKYLSYFSQCQTNHKFVVFAFFVCGTYTYEKCKIYKLRLHILNNGGQKIFISSLLCVWSAQICSPRLDLFFNRKVFSFNIFNQTRTPPARTRYNAQLNFPSLI